MTNKIPEIPAEPTPEMRRQIQRYGYLRARLVNFLETEKIPPDVGISLLLDVAA